MSHEHGQGDVERRETRAGNRVEPGHKERLPQDSGEHSDGERAEVVGGTGQEGDGRFDQTADPRSLIASASYWAGSVPAPEDMAAFKKVDATFPERILHMTEQTVETQNKALLSASRLEAWSVAITSVGYTVLPWAAALVFGFTGHDIPAAIAAVAGLAETGPKIIKAIKGDKSSGDEPSQGDKA
ncbi:hypothetical protein [Bifidobacterium miconisargentati]|uniref:hypothetical protein n=1 Tax=Bifidobacterium miconisargentati TaxID=2834437 RepID=UPI001BDC9168|nr:hypothetical protein [Bifidobacterium miconisargentati]MBW3090394.1 hypothetical protein [Bifidobacterium miconisargentati]